MESHHSAFAQRCMSLPPSPSESPAMSGDSSVSRKIDWDDTERALKRLSHHCNSKSRPRKSVQTAQYNPEKSILSKLRSDGSLKNHGELSTQSPNGQRTTVTQKANTQGEGGNHTSLLSINRSSTHPSKENPRTREFSSPSGAASQQTPQQVSTAAGQLFGEQEIITSTTSEEEENMAVGSEAANTSGGQMAEKRKMKRFRMTHAQTRHLLGEYSLQPHPDAAQRDRLSRDIPGLNPRQVQVWFQNRRAKLKRLTTDGQGCISRYRVLPEGSDFFPTLRPAFGLHQPCGGSIPPLSDQTLSSAVERPSLRLSEARVGISPSSVGSAYPNAHSAPMSADPSPVSLIHEGAQSSVSFYSGSCSHLINNPRFTNPFGQSNSSNRLSTYTRQHQFRLSDHSNMRHQSESHSSTAVSSEQFASSRSSFGDSGSNAALSPLQAPISQHLDQFQTSQAHPGDLGMVPRQEQMSPVASPVAFTYGQRQTAYPWSTAAAYPTSTYSTHTDPLRSPCHVQELGTEWAQKVSFSSQGFYPYSPDPQHLVSSTAAMTLQAVAQTHLPSGTASMGLGHLSLLSPHDSREERSTTR